MTTSATAQYSADDGVNFTATLTAGHGLRLTIHDPHDGEISGVHDFAATDTAPLAALFNALHVGMAQATTTAGLAGLFRELATAATPPASAA